MIVGKRQRQHQARLRFFRRAPPAFIAPWPRPRMADFRHVDDRREMRAANAALIGNGERAALAVLRAEILRSRAFMASSFKFLGKCKHVLFVHVAHHRHDQPCSVSTAMPMWIIFLVNDFPAASSRLELKTGCFFNASATDFKHEGSQRQARAFFFVSRDVFLAQVSSAVMSASSNCVTCGMAFQLSPMRSAMTLRKRRHRLLGNLAPLGEINVFRRGLCRRAGSGRACGWRGRAYASAGCKRARRP